MGGELAAGSWHHAPPPPGEARPGQPAPAPAQRAVTRARADRRVGQRDVKSLHPVRMTLMTVLDKYIISSFKMQ